MYYKKGTRNYYLILVNFWLVNNGNMQVITYIYYESRIRTLIVC